MDRYLHIFKLQASKYKFNVLSKSQYILSWSRLKVLGLKGLIVGWWEVCWDSFHAKASAYGQKKIFFAAFGGKVIWEN